MFEKILVPTVFSKYSQKVLECVKELPGAKEVVLLYVIGPADPLARVWDPGGRIEEAKVKLAEQKKLLENRGLNDKMRAEVIMEGDIARVIQKVADQEKISLIAMSARGKGIVEGIFLGNVARTSCAMEIRTSCLCATRFWRIGESRLWKSSALIPSLRCSVRLIYRSLLLRLSPSSKGLKGSGRFYCSMWSSVERPGRR